MSVAMAAGLASSRRIRLDDTPAAVGLQYEDVAFKSRGVDATLSGWLIPPAADGAGEQAEESLRDAYSSARWIVVVHGAGTNRADPSAGLLGLARDLCAEGFGLLLFDLRASGESGGIRSSAGYYERLDLLGALDELDRRGVDRKRIGVIGFSLGGAVAMMACANPGTAAAVVADSAFADLPLMIRESMVGIRRGLALMLPGMSFMTRVLYGINIDDVSPARSIASSDTPVLLIHGSQDDLVPRHHAHLLGRAAGVGFSDIEHGDQALWLVPGAGHVEAYRTRPAEYVSRVVSFFDEHLAG